MHFLLSLGWKRQGQQIKRAEQKEESTALQIEQMKNLVETQQRAAKQTDCNRAKLRIRKDDTDK